MTVSCQDCGQYFAGERGFDAHRHGSFKILNGVSLRYCEVDREKYELREGVWHRKGERPVWKFGLDPHPHIHPPGDAQGGLPGPNDQSPMGDGPRVA